jgi:hypothetical protein
MTAGHRQAIHMPWRTAWASVATHPAPPRDQVARVCAQDRPLDSTLIWDQRHLVQHLHEFECLDNRPHQGLANARSLYPLPLRSPTQTR